MNFVIYQFPLIGEGLISAYIVDLHKSAPIGEAYILTPPLLKIELVVYLSRWEINIGIFIFPQSHHTPLNSFVVKIGKADGLVKDLIQYHEFLSQKQRRGKSTTTQKGVHLHVYFYINILKK